MRRGISRFLSDILTFGLYVLRNVAPHDNAHAQNARSPPLKLVRLG